MTWSIGGGSGDAHEVHKIVREQEPPTAPEERQAFERARKGVLRAMEHAAEGDSLEAFTADVGGHGHGAQVHSIRVHLTRKQ